MKHCGTKKLETERLILRRFKMEDAQAMFQNWASDPEVTKFLTWPTHQNVDVTKYVLSQWIPLYDKPDYYHWTITRKENGDEPIGTIHGLIKEELELVTVGYCLSRKYWHQGIMSEALAALVDFFFSEVKANCINSYHDPRNPNSGLVMKKCGMQYDGTLRASDKNNTGICDASWYSLLREEWEKTAKAVMAGDRENDISAAQEVGIDSVEYCTDMGMKKIQLINDDYLGHVEHLRHAARGIIVKDGKVLLCYETKENKYIIPGGGVEDGESLAECCEREILEETGMKVRAVKEYLEIEELFLDWRHINHYFVCEFLEDTGNKHLTSGEIEAGYVNKYLPFAEALGIFGDFEKYHETDIADYGLYRREHLALFEYFVEEMFFDGSKAVIGHGAQADVYSYQGYAYKVYRPSYKVEWIAFEKQQQKAVNAAGLCPIRYYDTEEPHIVKMDLIEGETLEKQILQGKKDGFLIFADMFRKVHKVDPRGVNMPKFIDMAGFGLKDEEKEKIMPVIKQLSEKYPDRICHLDMHFLNIMMPADGSEPVIIDWINARIGPPVFDFARAYVILSEFAPEVLGTYKEAIAGDMDSLGITDEDFHAAVGVCTVIRKREKHD